MNIDNERKKLQKLYAILVIKLRIVESKLETLCKKSSKKGK